MGALFVAGGFAVAMIVALAAWELYRHLKKPDLAAERRMVWNAHAYELHHKNGWVPHELENGEVRWYRVLHDDAMDLPRP